MSAKETKQLLLDALRAIRKGPRRDAGICPAVSDAVFEAPVPDFVDFRARMDAAHGASKLLKSMFPNWPEYSGDADYPVPGDTDENPMAAYDYAWRLDAMWDRRTQYGKARWRLLEWLISELEKELGADSLPFGYLQFGKAPGPFRTQAVPVKNTHGDNWFASYEGRWRKVRIQVRRTYIVYAGERITIQIEGV